MWDYESIPVRDWSMYINSAYGISAHCMTYAEAVKVSGGLFNTGAAYWLTTAYDGPDPLYRGNNAWCVIYSMNHTNGNCFGVRPVITLKKV